MSTLRSAAILCRVNVPRACIPPSRPHALSRPFWHQAAVRSGPSRRPRAGFSPSEFSEPLLPRPRIPLPAPPRHCRAFRHLAQQPNNTPQSTATRESSPPPPPPSTETISNAEQRRRDWAVVRRLAVHIWPKDDWGTRGRVALGVGLLIGGKVRRTSALNYIFREMTNVVVAFKRPGPAVVQRRHRHA